MKGFLHPEGLGLVGELVDQWGYVIQIRGTPALRDGVKGHALTGKLVIPDPLKIPLFDDDPNGTAL